MSDKPVRVVSPKGRLGYPFLTKPDTKFNSEGEYKTHLFLASDEAEGLIAKLNEGVAKAVANAKADPKNKGKKIKEADLPVQWNEDETEVRLSFKLKATGKKRTGETFTQKPALFDAKGKPLPEGVKIGSGSMAKVSFEVIPFFTALVGAGVSLRMKAVQVINLKEFGSAGNGSAYGFDEEEGDEIDGSVSEEDFKDESAGGDDAPTDDNPDF